MQYKDSFYKPVRDGFMGIGPLLDNNYDGTVYIQGHVVIPNPWGDAVTNGTTTTDTEDVVTKEGGISVGDPECIIEQCERMARLYGLNFKRGVLSGDYSGETLYSGQDRNISEMSCEEIEHAMELASGDWNRLDVLYDYDIGDIDNYCNIYDLIMKHQGKEHNMHTACQYWQ